MSSFYPNRLPEHSQEALGLSNNTVLAYTVDDVLSKVEKLSIPETNSLSAKQLKAISIGLSTNNNESPSAMAA